MWLALFLLTFHLPKLSQTVISNLRGGWKNLICVYALKEGKTWIPVKLAVSAICLILKFRNIFLILKNSVLLSQCFKRTIIIVCNLID